TRMSTSPSSAAARLTAAASSTSNGYGEPPANSAVWAALGASRSAQTTSAPCAASARAHSRPMPLPAPTTTARRPSSRNSLSYASMVASSSSTKVIAAVAAGRPSPASVDGTGAHRRRWPGRAHVRASDLFVPVRGPEHPQVVEAAAGDLQTDRLPVRRPATVDRGGGLTGAVVRRREGDVLEVPLDVVGGRRPPRRLRHARRDRREHLVEVLGPLDRALGDLEHPV